MPSRPTLSNALFICARGANLVCKGVVEEFPFHLLTQAVGDILICNLSRSWCNNNVGSWEDWCPFSETFLQLRPTLSNALSIRARGANFACKGVIEKFLLHLLPRAVGDIPSGNFSCSWCKDNTGSWGDWCSLCEIIVTRALPCLTIYQFAPAVPTLSGKGSSRIFRFIY